MLQWPSPPPQAAEAGSSGKTTEQRQRFSPASIAHSPSTPHRSIDPSHLNARTQNLTGLRQHSRPTCCFPPRIHSSSCSPRTRTHQPPTPTRPDPSHHHHHIRARSASLLLQPAPPTMPPAARGRPVTLRDFLELGCDSSSDGFRSFPRRDEAAAAGVLQPQAPARRSVDSDDLRRSPSWSPTAFFLPKSPGALARISSLSRSFSRRISFWRRREDDDDFYFFDDRDSCGFPSPLVSSCSVSESSEYAESEADIVIEETSASASSSAPAPTPVSEREEASSVSASSCTTSAPGAASDGQSKALLDGIGDPAVGRNLEMEDKQQLSPVSVLDFPFDDDDGDEERSDAGTCSPSCFQHHNCAHNLQIKLNQAEEYPCVTDMIGSMARDRDDCRITYALPRSTELGTKNAPLLHKIRRFDGPTEAVDPVDLEARFTTLESGESVDDAHGGRCARLPSNSCTDEDSEATALPRHDVGEEHQSVERSECQQEPDDDEYRLLARLLDDKAPYSAAVDEVTEWLLLDFFADGIGRLRSVAGSVVGTVKPVDDGKVTALVEAAGEWLRGAGHQWGVGDVMFSGESALADMEHSRRWMCVRDEELDVGADVEGLVMDGLVDELVADLAPWWTSQLMELGTVLS
ncbi:hypothetical protein EJB05_08250, partial [Eragrostis curvula]